MLIPLSASQSTIVPGKTSEQVQQSTTEVTKNLQKSKEAKKPSVKPAKSVRKKKISPKVVPSKWDTSSDEKSKSDKPTVSLLLFRDNLTIAF
ncbi:hypothetical protein PGT21_017287 [Puccinia graminis f. sp. tritici]|uniref:Uncharacterized protein n=1 Tax=Puccinia graminis f. sp. tritici TaxID=56615 RepID=A0A5B0MMZ7_PUCGR|nr:hypothetical protein PGT21_017287 [Puccinia graminis f. sp. tritici]